VNATLFAESRARRYPNCTPHGYLLSSFISPLTNQRSDNYVPAGQPAALSPEVQRDTRGLSTPMSVRISATDWAEGGTRRRRR
jgi:anthraniloyl-CoA monooxygenase